ncbi:MAG TPA: serine hydrolase domain-containing protein [Gemmatimonas sp.]|nr:serine hydrolase domain-containing protein [Gemmatimonas sp.]
MHPAARVLHEQVAGERTPGISYLHFSGDAILFRHHEGAADIARRVTIDRETTFNAQSVTKTVTTVAALQLVESGAIALADLAHFPYSNPGHQLLGQLVESLTGMRYECYITEEVLARIGVTADELGFSVDSARHACGYHKRRSSTYPSSELLLDRSRAHGGCEDAWQRCRPHYNNGPAYRGLIGTADGFARYLQALLDGSGTLLTPASQDLLFAEHLLSDGTRAPTALSWFRGALGVHRYFDHAGGGGGYYAEVRVYPELRRGSVLLCNRTGFRNDRILDEVDRHLVDSMATVSEDARARDAVLSGPQRT